MIHRLEIENFYSIRETQVIDLRIGAKVPDEEGRFGCPRDDSDVRVPKTVAFFGANASGKSNVLRALAFIEWFLADSFTLTPDEPLPLWRFADGNDSPIRIKIDFDWLVSQPLSGALPGPESRVAHYIYEVKFGGESENLQILSEELRLQPASGKSRRIFERSVSGEVQGSVDFPLTGFGQVLSKLRGNVSLTSTMAQFSEHEASKAFWDWAGYITSNIFNIPIYISFGAPFGEKEEISEERIVRFYKERPRLVDSLNGALRRVDIGIRSMSFRDTTFGPVPQFHHLGLDHPIEYRLESEGTRQFFRVYGHIWQSIENGGIAVLDEIDSTIHPILLPEILHWFHDPLTNPHQAQLWIGGHSASLLEELKKEEIFFTEKDQQGRTKVYGLKDIEAVRRVDNFYQKYLGGVYGAVPRIG
jgi:hypothetical protein